MDQPEPLSLLHSCVVAEFVDDSRQKNNDFLLAAGSGEVGTPPLHLSVFGKNGGRLWRTEINSVFYWKAILVQARAVEVQRLVADLLIPAKIVEARRAAD
jgi:hypothetical protein